MSEKCSEHTNLMCVVTEIQTDVKHLIKMQNGNVGQMQDHLKDAEQRQQDIAINNQFRAGATKALWIIFIAIVGIAARVMTLK